jgi:hypothetical protein
LIIQWNLLGQVRVQNEHELGERDVHPEDREGEHVLAQVPVVERFTTPWSAPCLLSSTTTIVIAARQACQIPAKK